MDNRYEYKTAAYLIMLFISVIMFGIAVPVGTGIIVEGVFFRTGSFSLELVNTWTTIQWIGAVVLSLLAIAFEVFCIVTAVNIIKEFVRRRKASSSGQYESSVIQTQEYEY